MASYLKSIDSNHLLEVELEGFYEQSDLHKQQNNLNFEVGIVYLDFATATVHSYQDHW